MMILGWQVMVLGRRTLVTTDIAPVDTGKRRSRTGGPNLVEVVVCKLSQELAMFVEGHVGLRVEIEMLRLCVRTQHCVRSAY
jgi:hypothetical protein